MKIYLASRYSRREEMKKYAVLLRAAGHEIVTRWLETEWGDRPGESSAAPAEYREKYAVLDMEDVLSADLVISFTEPPAGVCGKCEGIGVVFWPSEDGGSPPMECPGCKGKGRTNAGRGGRHVEFGAAYAAGKRVFVVGYRENIFHHLPRVEFFDFPEYAITALTVTPSAPA